MPTEVQIINKYLKKKHGCDDLGRPYFRVMFCNRNYTEKRLGTYNDFWRDIYLRTVTEVRETPKYSANNIHERFVLEGLVYSPHPELVESMNGHYEMLWPFVNFHDGSYLPPKREVCDIIIFEAKRKKRSSSEIRRYYEDIDDKQQKEEEALFRDMIEEASPYLAMQLKEGHATGYGTKEVGR